MAQKIAEHSCRKWTPVIANLSNTNTEIILADDKDINLLKQNEHDMYTIISHFQPGFQIQEVH